MKPASIISLIIAVLLVIVGLVTCFIAQNMAQANGEFLFAEEVEGSRVVTEPLSEEITKIALVFSDAKVNIYGRCDRENSEHYSDTAKIEFVNFKENYYTLNNKNNLLSFDEIPNLTSMLKFWENGFSFKGMRYILNAESIREILNKEEEKEDTDKQINVYLTSAMTIKNFDIKASGETSVFIESMRTETDYNITGETVILDVQSTTSDSAININSDSSNPAKSAEVNITRAILGYVTVNAETVDFSAASLNIKNEMKVSASDGVIRIGTSNSLPTYNLEIRSSGRMQVSGSDVSSPYSFIAGSGLPSINIDAGEGDVSVYENSADSLPVSSGE